MVDAINQFYSGVLSMENDEKLLSICVITYNSGKKALNIAEKLSTELADDWEMIFFDNASSVETEYYQALAELANRDERIGYVQQAAHQGIARNFLACFQGSLAPYIMILTDEDYPEPAMLKEVLPMLMAYPNVGVMRGSIASVAGDPLKIYDEAAFFAGEEAFLGFFLENWLFSGTIYHRKLLGELGLVGLLADRVVDYGVAMYPNAYLELLACAKTDIVTTALIACYKTPGQPFWECGPEEYVQPNSFGSRIDQFIILRNTLIDAVMLLGEPFDRALFAAMYLKLCDKYMYFISHVNSNLYLQHNLHPGLLLQSMFHACWGAISSLSAIADFYDYLFEQIKLTYENHNRYINSIIK